MPNRILKETICTSEQIDSLSPEAEAFFYRLIVNCDDFGRLDARIPILKSKCYPLKSIDSKCLQEMLYILRDAGLVFLYSVDGKPFMSLISWEKHQQIRAKRSKYPAPNDGVAIIGNHLISDEIICPRNPIQSNPESNPIQSPALPVADNDDVKLARFMYQRILVIQPKVKEPRFDKWANTIRLMREQDGRTHKQIQDAFIFANKDQFWKSNILSPDALRKQIDKLEIRIQTNTAVVTQGFIEKHTDKSWREGL